MNNHDKCPTLFHQRIIILLHFIRSFICMQQIYIVKHSQNFQSPKNQKKLFDTISSSGYNKREETHRNFSNLDTSRLFPVRLNLFSAILWIANDNA